MQVHERLSEEFPTYRANAIRNEGFTERALRTGEAQRVMRRLVRIPTVVHVLYKRDSENISKRQIASQITALTATSAPRTRT